MAAGIAVQRSDDPADLVEELYSYDVTTGNVTWHKSPLEVGTGALSRYTRDERGRLRTVEEAVDSTGSNFAVTSYAYDERDALSAILSADGIETLLDHDWVGKRTNVRRDGKIWSYTYDSAGNKTAVVSPIPENVGAIASDYTTTYAYDPLGRISQRVAAPRD